MVAKLPRLSHKIVIQLYLVAESCTICSSRSRRPVRKLLDTPLYSSHNIFTKRLARHVAHKENMKEGIKYHEPSSLSLLPRTTVAWFILKAFKWMVMVEVYAIRSNTVWIVNTDWVCTSVDTGRAEILKFLIKISTFIVNVIRQNAAQITGCWGMI
jgi:hypothetical protein